MAQSPCIGMLGVCDPGAHAGVDVFKVDTAGSPLIAQAAQTVAEAPHVVFRETATSIVIKHEAKKLRRLPAR